MGWERERWREGERGGESEKEKHLPSRRESRTVSTEQRGKEREKEKEREKGKEREEGKKMKRYTQKRSSCDVPEKR